MDTGYLSFTGQAGCYAELPLSVLPAATTFTIEVKFSTTSKKSSTSNWTWGTIVGRELPDHWQDDFGFCVNDGKLCFWAEPKAKNSLTQGTGGVLSNVVVNDGKLHKAAVVSSNSAIYLYCDGQLVASQANVKAKTPTSQKIMLAQDSNPNSYLQMDLYEARFWNFARTQEQIFADIDGSETGLQAWYLPSEDGLLDYSGNNRHATLYGNPVYTQIGTIDFKPEVFMSWIPHGEINFKPEVFMSWIPHGEINFKPELFASIIDDSTKVEFTADLSRNITRTESFTADLQRNITKTVDFCADLQRSLVNRVEFSVDLQRKIFKFVDMRVDLQRKLSNFVEFNADLQRKLTNVVEFTVDLQRIFTGNVAFTVDLQTRIIWQWLTRILPESSFLDSKMYASAEALDVQITKFHQAIREVLHLPRLDELSGIILDLLAEQFHIDAYDAINFSDEEKRNLIRESIAWHRIKGTPAAVETILTQAFKDLHIDEWFNYGGEPYYFRIYTTGYISTPERFQSFWNMFWDAKNVRSHLEKFIIDLSRDEPINVYVGIAKVTNGTKKIGLPRPQNTSGNIYTGIAQIRSGVKTVGMHHNPF